jgi:hypothetical protein
LDGDLHVAGLDITLREIRVRIPRKGFRSLELRLWTTPLDQGENARLHRVYFALAEILPLDPAGGGGECEGLWKTASQELSFTICEYFTTR